MVLLLQLQSSFSLPSCWNFFWQRYKTICCLLSERTKTLLSPQHRSIGLRSPDLQTEMHACVLILRVFCLCGSWESNSSRHRGVMWEEGCQFSSAQKTSLPVLSYAKELLAVGHRSLFTYMSCYSLILLICSTPHHAVGAGRGLEVISFVINEQKQVNDIMYNLNWWKLQCDLLTWFQILFRVVSSPYLVLLTVSSCLQPWVIINYETT